MRQFVKESERGELGLYKLAPQLGAKRNPTRKAYVKLLDFAGTALDLELRHAKNIDADANLLASGQCTRGTNDLKLDVDIIRTHRSVLDTDLTKLHARFG